MIGSQDIIVESLRLPEAIIAAEGVVVVSSSSMPHIPDKDRFSELAQSSRLVPVFRRLFADSLTPLSAFARIDSGDSGCLFESVVGGEKVGRYSFLGADPFIRLEAYGNQVQVFSKNSLCFLGITVISYGNLDA